MIKPITMTTIGAGLCGVCAYMLMSFNVSSPDNNTDLDIDSEAANTTPEPIATEFGIASWYSIKTNFGTQTASGRPLQNDAYTAAHKKWPMGSKVKVTNLENGHSEILTITDRGPYIEGRIIDVTTGSAKRLGFYEDGLTQIKIELLSRGNWKYQH